MKVQKRQMLTKEEHYYHLKQGGTATLVQRLQAAHRLEICVTTGACKLSLLKILYLLKKLPANSTVPLHQHCSII